MKLFVLNIYSPTKPPTMPDLSQSHFIVKDRALLEIRERLSEKMLDPDDIPHFWDASGTKR